ncbi:MAG: hypothetical protein KGZ59_09230 [Chitinophagaceae bacterium]|nr:hypothetical protein [Chitinophagaceae bacterium]
MQKQQFIQQDFLKLVSTLSADQKGNWGVMNAQQMVEHVADFFKVSYGKLKFQQVTPPEQLSKFRDFLWSDKEFRENTKAPMLPETPFSVRHAEMQGSLHELENDIAQFFSQFHQNESTTTLHPVFGDLNFDDWVQLHYKHTLHHAKQFGLI